MLKVEGRWLASHWNELRRLVAEAADTPNSHHLPEQAR